MDSRDPAACSARGRSQHKCSRDDGDGMGRDGGGSGGMEKEGAIEDSGGVGFEGGEKGAWRVNGWGGNVRNDGVQFKKVVKSIYRDFCIGVLDIRSKSPWLTVLTKLKKKRSRNSRCVVSYRKRKASR